ncbi:hypothetical protein QZJ86_20125 [Methylomonas montana]|uniref:hypothetical protein n=1 Tax=Methylomonas montana TaxID=3058963 RepID=UPI00265A81A6|nr:hypothetical protein [Methylomonas montana]WKJ90289.1 hypothetical protein QZJ86_20125 [Methylomonas montana]
MPYGILPVYKRRAMVATDPISSFEKLNPETFGAFIGMNGDLIARLAFDIGGAELDELDRFAGVVGDS